MSDYYCDECGCKLEGGSVYTDDLHNYFCDEFCAMEYHGIEETDEWPGNDDDNDTVEPKETLENYYNAYFAKFGFITNGHYLIWGVNIANEIDTGCITSDDVQKLIHKTLTSVERAKATPLSYELLHEDDACYSILGRVYKAEYVDFAYRMLHAHTLNAFSCSGCLVLLDGDSGGRGAIVGDWECA